MKISLTSQATSERSRARYPATSSSGTVGGSWPARSSENASSISCARSTAPSCVWSAASCAVSARHSASGYCTR